MFPQFINEIEFMMSEKRYDEIIEAWFSDHGLDPGPDFAYKVRIYKDLIQEWSNRINIVSKNDLEILMERHILDSLVPLKEIPESGNMVDIGSGAGFPAVPIALARPRLDIVMIESIGKKAVFLDEVISRLELRRISIWNGRFEDFHPVTKYDIATIRAVKLTDKIRLRLTEIIRDSGKIIYYNKFGHYELIY